MPIKLYPCGCNSSTREKLAFYISERDRAKIYSFGGSLQVQPHASNSPLCVLSLIWKAPRIFHQTYDDLSIFFEPLTQISHPFERHYHFIELGQIGRWIYRFDRHIFSTSDEIKPSDIKFAESLKTLADATETIFDSTIAFPPLIVLTALKLHIGRDVELLLRKVLGKRVEFKWEIRIVKSLELSLSEYSVVKSVLKLLLSFDWTSIFYFQSVTREKMRFANFNETFILEICFWVYLKIGTLLFFFLVTSFYYFRWNEKTLTKYNVEKEACWKKIK